MPADINDGLWVYDSGQGPAVLLMPYPHSYSTTNAANSAIARSLLQCGLRVITFDPPGSYHSTRRPRRMPLDWWPFEPHFWQFVLPAMRLRKGWGTLADQEKVARLSQEASFVDKGKIFQIAIHPRDEHLPAPIRSRWPAVAMKVDYRPRLKDVRVPTLVCVGRYDPQAPVGCSEEIARGIPGARLVVFERSGHSPHGEEPEQFKAIVARSCATDGRDYYGLAAKDTP